MFFLQVRAGNLENLNEAALCWLAMLACSVTIEMVLTRLPQRSATPSAVACTLCGLLAVILLDALELSVFPCSISDALTLWNAAATTNSMQLLLVGIGVSLLMVLMFNFLAYRSIFDLAVRSPKSTFSDLHLSSF